MSLKNLKEFDLNEESNQPGIEGLAPIVTKLREAAKELRKLKGETIVIPAMYGEKSEKQTLPLGMKPGDYDADEIAGAIQYLADMLE